MTENQQDLLVKYLNHNSCHPSSLLTVISKQTWDNLILAVTSIRQTIHKATLSLVPEKSLAKWLNAKTVLSIKNY